MEGTGLDVFFHVPGPSFFFQKGHLCAQLALEKLCPPLFRSRRFSQTGDDDIFAAVQDELDAAVAGEDGGRLGRLGQRNRGGPWPRRLRFVFFPSPQSGALSHPFFLGEG